MAVKIGHASMDENKHASGGNAGDQTGKEVCTREWYNKPWIAVIRPNKTIVAEKIAKAMEQATANDNIGYDQSQRTTLYTNAKAANWDISKVKVKCETDCSALVAVCVNAAGITVSKDMYTGNEKNALTNTGEFQIFTDKKYLESSSLLKRGDILLGSGHTAVVLSDGTGENNSKDNGTNNANKVDSAKSYAKGLAGAYKVTASSLNMRAGAGTGKKILLSIPKGKKVTCYGYYTTVNGTKWYLVSYNGNSGYVSSTYLSK